MAASKKKTEKKPAKDDLAADLEGLVDKGGKMFTLKKKTAAEAIAERYSLLVSSGSSANVKPALLLYPPQQKSKAHFTILPTKV